MRRHDGVTELNSEVGMEAYESAWVTAPTNS